MHIVRSCIHLDADRWTSLSLNSPIESLITDLTDLAMWPILHMSETASSFKN